MDLWFLADSKASDVTVVGDFNGWTPTALTEVEPGAFWLRVEPGAGDYRYLFEVEGELVLDPFARLTFWDAALQREVGLLRVQNCEKPALELETVEVGANQLVASVRVWEGEHRVHEARATLNGEALTVRVDKGRIDIEKYNLPYGKYTLFIQVIDEENQSAELRVPLWIEDQVFSWESAVIYEIMVDRFWGEGELSLREAGAGSRAGGNLIGIITKINEGYFQELGVNVLWLSPVNEGPQGFFEGRDGRMYENYHGYWPISVDTVDPNLGTEADLQALVKAAHAQGIRVMLDIVPNHVHEQHPYRENPAWFHENPDCICGDYTCPWSEAIQTCWFAPYLPDLAYENPLVAQTVIPDWLSWATAYDLDGFRVDAVPMMPRAAIRELQYGIDQTFAGPTEFYTIGETFTGATDYDSIRYNLGPYGLGGQFDFPTMWAIRGFLAWQTLDAGAFETAIQAAESAWEGSGAVMGQFVGNHDTTRFLSEAAHQDLSDPWGNPPASPTDPTPYQKMLLAHTLTASIPGAIVLWQGDEYGEAGANDPDNRRPFRQSLSAPEQALWDATRVLLQARGCSRALGDGERTGRVASKTVWASERQSGESVALTVINTGTDTATVLLDSQTSMTDIWTHEEISQGSVRVDIPPLTARLFLSDAHCILTGAP